MSKGKETPNPTMAMLWFLILTTVYFPVKYFVATKKMAGVGKVAFAIYLLLLIAGELTINIGLTKSMCSAPQFTTAILATLVPWVIVFGVLNLMLMVYPAWLSPFSNTFGYGIAKLMGVSSTMDELFVKSSDGLKGNKESLKEANKTLAQIYRDKSLLINEITEENFETFWKRMTPLFLPGVKDNIGLKTTLLNQVRAKTTTSEYIWYLLTGWLVTSSSFNYLVKAGCDISPTEQKRRDNLHSKKQESKNTNSVPSIVYTSYD